MALVSSLAVTTGTDNPSKPVSKDEWNALITKAGRDVPITPQDFGAVGDDTTDDGPAFAAALAYLFTVRNTGYGYGQGSRRLFIPAGKYYLGTTTLDLTHTLIVEGENCGGPAGAATVLRWAAGATGIRTQSYNTSGGTGASVVTSYGSAGGTMSIIRNLHLRGGFTNTEAEYHGIQLRAKAVVRDVFIENFQGDGLHCSATVGSGTVEGNCNGSLIENVFVRYCRDGMYFYAPDTNAIQIINPTINTVRRHGIVSKDNIGLNIWGGDCSTSGGGEVLAAPIYNKVSHGGRWYFVLPGQEAWASVNAPPASATNNQGWAYMVGPGVVAGEFPAWSNGINLRAAFPIWIDGGSSYNSVIGFYQEGDQPPSFVSEHTHWNCPMAAAVTTGGTFYGGQFRYSSSQVNVLRSFRVGSAGETYAPSADDCALFVDGNIYLARDVSVAYDPALYINSTNAYASVGFQHNGTDKAQIQYYTGDGYLYYLVGGAQGHKFYANGAQVAEIAANSIKVGSTKVLGAQGAAVADATDAASTMARLNDVLARLRAHGIIAT